MKTLGIVLAALVAVTFAVSHYLNADEPRGQMRSKLVDLHVERAEAAVAFGASHPAVKKLDAEIANLEARIGSQRKPVDEMTDAELRQAVQNLLKRVQRLEHDVSELKERKPKMELLGR